MTNLRVLCYAATTLAVLSILTWLAFGVSWWHPSNAPDDRRGCIIFFVHVIALMAAPLCALCELA